MKNLLNIIFCLFLIISNCRSDKNADYVTLRGNIKDILNGKLYLESNDIELPYLDSVEVKNGEFIYKHSKLQESIKIKIYFYDGDLKKRTLCYKDPNRNKYVYNQLILENGEITLTGNSYKELYLQAHNENKLFLNFNQEGTIKEYYNYNPDGTFKNFKIIKENPKSTYLLRYLYSEKVLLNLQDLKKQFSLFDKSILKTTIGRKMSNYILSKEKVNKEIIDDSFKFNDTSGTVINLKHYLTEKKFNLYVFWASWCVPCRKEIPALKKFNKSYGNDINIISLSIDSETEKWKSAVKEEKMPWINLSSLPYKPAFLKEKFFINSVPQLMLINNSGEKILTVTNDLDSVVNFLKKIK